jgi:hypothetical protein
MRRLFFVFCVIIGLTSNGQGTIGESNSKVFNNYKDVKNNMTDIPDSLQRTSIDSDELKLVDRILSQCIFDSHKGNHVMKIGEMLYYYQLFPYFNATGEKVVWVNALAKESVEKDDMWQNECVRVFDGYNYFWNVHLNLSKKEYQNLYVNGI